MVSTFQPRPAPPTPAPGTPPCRATLAAGGVSPTLDVRDWITLPEGGRVTLKSSGTGREMTWLGAARARPCAEEVALLAEGSVHAIPGAGEGPGSEQWVATPHLALRWATGAHRARVDAGATTLDVTAPGVSAWIAEDVTAIAEAGAPRVARPDAGADDGFLRLAAGHLVLGWKRAELGAGAIERGLVSCEQAAAAAKAIADEMAKAGSPRPRLAEMHVTARGVARASCAVARARVGPGADNTYTPRLEKAEATYRAVVVGPAPSMSAAPIKLPPR